MRETDWMEIWDRRDWRTRVVDVLCEIVESPDATTEDRLLALSLLNEGMRSGVLPEDENLPDLAVLVGLHGAMGGFSRPWWKRFGLKKRQKVIADQVMAARFLLLTAGQFAMRSRIEEAFSMTAAAAKNSDLLS